MKLWNTVEYIDSRTSEKRQKQCKEKCLNEGFNLYFNDATDMRFYLDTVGSIAAVKDCISLKDILSLAMVDFGFEDDFFVKHLYGYDLATILKLEPKTGRYWGEYMITFPRPYTFSELCERMFYGS